MNNSKKAEIDYLIFNRVPKVGSQSMMALMKKLGKILDYGAARDKPKQTEDVLMNHTLQLEFVNDILENPPGSVYSKHTAYVDFQRLGFGKPIYINLVRDPIERIISWYYYVRAPWYYIEMKAVHPDYPLPESKWIKKDFEDCVMDPNDIECTFIDGTRYGSDHRRQTLFFCGQDADLCMPFNSVAAMQKAKENVEREYAVVGSWEDQNITLSVLEHYLPRYFKGALEYFHKYKHDFEETNKNKFKPIIPEYVKDMLRKNFTNEIEFYEFCKQRLYTQYLVLLQEKDIKDSYL